MEYIYAKSAMGYSHRASKKPCQDFSIAYQDPVRKIITCCDGHGGLRYIRSKIGSELASNAVFNVFTKISIRETKNFDDEKYLDRIKLAILCEWNKLVEKDVSSHPFRHKEFKGLDEEKIQEIKSNVTRAYGTTLSGAILINNKLLIVGIGDTECIYISKGHIYKVFDDEGEPFANITYSMCQEDAYAHLHIKAIDIKDIDGLILGTDGLTSPYQSYDNFNINFVHPLMKKILVEQNFKYIDLFIDSLAVKLGVGDDVSIAYLIKSQVYKKYYK